MKITNIEIKNFKGFEDFTTEIDDKFTLLIGDNGTGKTAILDALAVGLNALLSDFPEQKSPDPIGITDEQVRQLKYDQGDGTITIEPQYPVSITFTGFFYEHEMQWEQGIDGKNQPQRIDQKIKSFSKQLYEKSKTENIILPLFAYYGTDRLWRQEKTSSQNSILETRTQGYLNCLHPDSNLKSLIKWLEKQEKDVILNKQSNAALEVVKNAISECMENWNIITYGIRKSEVLATSLDGQTVPLNMLSDGVRNMLAMVADIAYRAVILNPHLDKDAAKKTPGIVLIDEIDLHLHPKWQRRVVEDLYRTFPNIQFVATTHSPFIIQSLRIGKLVNLVDIDQEVEYYSQSIEDITEDVMYVELPQQSKRFLEKMAVAEEYYRVLAEAKNANPERLEYLKNKLDELTMPYSDDPAYHALLKIERLASGINK